MTYDEELQVIANTAYRHRDLLTYYALQVSIRSRNGYRLALVMEMHRQMLSELIKIHVKRGD